MRVVRRPNRPVVEVAGGHVHALYRHGHSVVHRMAPQVKIVAAFGFVLAVVITPREAFWAFGLYLAALMVLMAIARLPLRFVLRRMVVEIPFLIVAIMLPLFGSGERIDVAGLSLSEQGLWDMWNLLAKATLGLLTAIVLGATTQVPDLIKGLDALHVPAVVTAIISFMVRYIDVILGEFSRMQVAMASRGHEVRSVMGWRPYAKTFGAMFVRTYERGERVYLAMASRGYSGTMPASLRVPAPGSQWVIGLGLIAAAWLVAYVAWAQQ